MPILKLLNIKSKPLCEGICLCLLLIFDEAQASLQAALICLLLLHSTSAGCLLLCEEFWFSDTLNLKLLPKPCHNDFITSYKTKVLILKFLSTKPNPLCEEICLCLLMIFDETQASLQSSPACLLLLHGTVPEAVCLCEDFEFQTPRSSNSLQNPA